MSDLAPLLAVADPPLKVVLFFAFSGLAVGSAIVAIAAPRIVHAAFGLLGAFFGVAGLYALLGADFVALAQILVYVGGILVLLVFGVLLTERLMGPLGLEDRRRNIWPVLAGGLLLVGLFAAIHASEFPLADEVGEPAPTVHAIGRAFLDPEQHLVAFELASVLLLAALVGAAYLVRRRRRT